MPLHINAVCDRCKTYAQNGAFDHDHETASDYKNALKSIGWKVEGGEGTANLHLICPLCNTPSTSDENT
jgi:hypothetical protein